MNDTSTAWARKVTRLAAILKETYDGGFSERDLRLATLDRALRADIDALTDPGPLPGRNEESNE